MQLKKNSTKTLCISIITFNEWKESKIDVESTLRSSETARFSNRAKTNKFIGVITKKARKGEERREGYRCIVRLYRREKSRSQEIARIDTKWRRQLVSTGDDPPSASITVSNRVRCYIRKISLRAQIGRPRGFSEAITMTLSFTQAAL